MTITRTKRPPIAGLPCKYPLAAVALAAALSAAGQSAVELTTPEEQALRAADQGRIVPLPGLAAQGPHSEALPLEIRAAPGPQLLFSDLPEYFLDNNGISLMEEMSAGKYRLYVYHVPGTEHSPKTVSAVVENLAGRTLRLDFMRTAFPPPGTAYRSMGAAALVELFSATRLPPPLIIGPGCRAVLDGALDATVAANPQLVHAIYEFQVDGPARLLVFQRNAGESSTTIIDTLRKLPRQLPGRPSSGAGRGLFAAGDLSVTNAPGTIFDTAGGVKRLVLADGKRDRWIKGRDGLSGGQEVENRGNYGVIYHIRLAYSSSDGRPTAIVVGGRGATGSVAGRPVAVFEVSAGVWPAGLVAFAGKEPVDGGAGALGLVQELAPPGPGAVSYVDLVYSPPGGSSLPLPILLVPL